ncbi:Sir2 family NAD+-dependent deacetylase [Neisseria sp. Ec49-e6-T10]|uniref:Sir2 family NAD+-dependent deacetylase n=1 Tax=Neisseria sp. Ec49-e6-T10 TaxID=3140744 RepID=UPI003EBF43E2
MQNDSLPKVVVLTGAGISAESGIQTFRDGDGLWEKHRVEDVATFDAYCCNPELVQRFYNARRRTLKQPDIQPNPAHFALTQLEQKLGGQFLLVTQNIDDLHERAGSQNIIHMHGELLKARCTGSGQVFEQQTDLSTTDYCPCCQVKQPLRPHIVWFGEVPLQMDDIFQALANADYFISIGTSGHVYPAAGFVAFARQNGARTIELNLEPSKVQNQFHQNIYGQASMTVPDFVQDFLTQL